MKTKQCVTHDTDYNSLMSNLSDKLRELVDELEDTELDDDRDTNVTTRMSLTEEKKWKSFSESDVNWDTVQFDDVYNDTFQVTFFLR